MARLARVVIPGVPHHVTQRGNGRARTFFSPDDYRSISTPPVTDTAPVRARYPDFAALIAEGEDADMSEALRQAESIGRPLGDERFLSRLSRLTGRSLKPGKRGPKPRDEWNALSP